MTKEPRNKWLLAFVLTIPVLVFFAGYLFNHNPAYSPTGLIMDDNALYVSYAKQYADADHTNLLYSNPFNDSGNYHSIYFQTQSLLLAGLLKTGLDAGYVMIVFVLLFSFLTFRVIIELHDTLVTSRKYRLVTIVLLAWGGGLLALAGVPLHFFRAADGQDMLDRIFFLDPAWGWWGMNLGRSLFITCEAYYHFLFLLSVLMIVKRKWSLALICLFILSVSHPFTGIELLSILAAWLFVEKIFVRNKTIPWYFAIGASLIMAFHIYYYLFYLNQFADHRSVNEQFSVNWRLRFFTMIPAWALVAPLAYFSIFKLSKPRQYFQTTEHRLFACWLIVVILLSNHELFMKPRQPIHFTRGYDWLAFFFLGLPALQWLYKSLENISKRTLYLGIIVTLFLSDNFLWIVNYVRFTNKTASVMYTNAEQRMIINSIKENSDNKTLLVSGDYDISLLTPVYTKAWPWISNPYTTPFYATKKNAWDRFIKTSIPDSAWKGREVIFVLNKNDSLENHIGEHMRLVKETENYRVVKVDSADH